jgi:hypothetical protein
MSKERERAEENTLPYRENTVENGLASSFIVCVL